MFAIYFRIDSWVVNIKRYSSCYMTHCIMQRMCRNSLTNEHCNQAYSTHTQQENEAKQRDEKTQKVQKLGRFNVYIKSINSLLSSACSKCIECISTLKYAQWKIIDGKIPFKRIRHMHTRVRRQTRPTIQQSRNVMAFISNRKNLISIDNLLHSLLFIYRLNFPRYVNIEKIDVVLSGAVFSGIFFIYYFLVKRREGNCFSLLGDSNGTKMILTGQGQKHKYLYGWLLSCFK